MSNQVKFASLGDVMSSERGQLLIIDDEEEILKALKRQFRDDYEVFVARNADDGYRIMTETPIQVIISDQRMPGMNGSEFFNRVKTYFPDAVRLLLTGYADIQTVIDAINDGNIFRYVIKPWNPAELATVVREAFTRYDLVVQNRRLLEELQHANALLEARVIERTEALEDANYRLRNLVEQRDRFIGMAAHDLRTPIQVVQGFTDLLLHPQTRPDEFGEFVLIIQDTLRDMLTLLNNLLDITAIESGKIILNPALVNVNSFIERVAKRNRMLAEKKGIHLNAAVEPDVPAFSFDQQRIEQVLNNLLSNAFKFSYSGSTVSIDVKRLGKEIILEIADQGIGIPEEEISKIFNEFQRTSNQPTGSESSTGLGLSICRRLIELHEGSIGVTSVVGQGSKFYFTLPLRT
jgi:signal transduction histidine kinase